MANPTSAHWRSLLFVPADNTKLLEKAHQRGADAVILDLEDAVPVAGKPQSRAQVAGWIDTLAASGASVLVRVNSGWLDLIADLDAIIRPGLAAIVLPQVKDVVQPAALDGIVSALEDQRGLPVGGIGLVALIESPATLSHLHSIAALPRTIGLALGSEDFSLTLRAEPALPALTLPCQMIAHAAAEKGLMAIGLPDSLANFRDLDRYGIAAAHARAMGMTGALCIHPAQIAIINQAFAPTETQQNWAKRILEAWAQAEAAGSGVAALDGQMIDRPVVERARAIRNRYND